MRSFRHAVFAAPAAVAAAATLAAAPPDRLGQGAAQRSDAIPAPQRPAAVAAPRHPPVSLRAARPAPAPAIPPELQRIAACESGGDPAAIGGGGAYRGKYQFTRETWQALGGRGDPAAASEAEQDRRALALYSRSGAASWPGCSG